MRLFPRRHPHPRRWTEIFTGVEAASVNPPTGVIACPDCGAVQALRSPGGHVIARCFRCRGILERTAGRSLDAAAACALAVFALLFPANILPLMRVSVAGATTRTRIISGVFGFWHQGWPVVALVVGFEVVVIPFLRFGLLVVVLGALRAGFQAPWMGPVFRWSQYLDEWAMPDVFLFGAVIGYARVAPFLPVTIDPGGYCFIAVAILTLMTRAALERRAVWRRIAAPAARTQPDMIGCTACDLAVPGALEGTPCPRCRLRLWRLKPRAYARTIALTLAAVALYPIAYTYPMETSDRISSLHPYSILTGVRKLLHAHLWLFAAIVFTASVLIPFTKLLLLSWFTVSIHMRSTRHIPLKTRLYRAIVGIGRWSHIDVFTVAVFLPLMHLPGFLRVIAGRALPAYLAVVVLTMLATDSFDPRALWFAAQSRHE